MRGIIGLKQARRNEQLSDIVGPDGLFLVFFLSLSAAVTQIIIRETGSLSVTFLICSHCFKENV